MARPGEGAGPGGRVEARQFVRQEEGVPVFAEIGADIHQVAQQTGLVIHLSLQARARQQHKACAEQESKTAVSNHKSPLSELPLSDLPGPSKSVRGWFSGSNGYLGMEGPHPHDSPGRSQYPLLSESVAGTGALAAPGCRWPGMIR